MMLNILRGLFVLLMASVGWAFAIAEPEQAGTLQGNQWLAPAAALIVGVGLICIDILAGRRKFAVFTGVAFGILVGLTITYALSFGVQLIIDNLIRPESVSSPANRTLVTFINLLVGMAACYFAVSFILQTKDDFRFIIPYVEFRRDARGPRPIILDTSALIDGRVADLAETGFIDSQLVVPQFVVQELQTVADSRDRLKRARGRRGLDVLNRLKSDGHADVRMFDSAAADQKDTPVDQRLINLALELDGRAMTTDFNLNKVAQVAGVPVLNLNELSNALKPEVLPGEVIRVQIVKPGTAEAQGIGYLDDGTMVVVEHGRDQIDREVDLVVTNTTQTAAGRMVFGRAITAKDALESNGDGQSVEPSEPARLAGPAGASERGTGRAHQQRQEAGAGKSGAATS
jgi:uncharacterized protein YacL